MLPIKNSSICDDISFRELFGRIRVFSYKIRYVPSYDKVFVPTLYSHALHEYPRFYVRKEKSEDTQKVIISGKSKDKQYSGNQKPEIEWQKNLCPF